MLEPRTAEIILFPLPPPTVERSSPREPERLNKALVALDTALAAQRQAIAEWRAALADLQGATLGLSETVQAHHGGLDALGVRVAALRSETEGLVECVDRACAS